MQSGPAPIFEVLDDAFILQEMVMVSMYVLKIIRAGPRIIQILNLAKIARNDASNQWPGLSDVVLFTVPIGTTFIATL